MAIVTPSEVREVCALTSSDISDSDLKKLISRAYAKIVKDTSFLVRDERVLWMDQGRTNIINGVNKTYWVYNSYGNNNMYWLNHNFGYGHYLNYFIYSTYSMYLADMDLDGAVTKTDVLVHQFNSTNTMSVAEVESVTNTGSFTLKTAPPAGTRALLITYRYSPVDFTTPPEDLKLACMYLAAALAYTRIGDSNITRLTLGKLSVFRNVGNYQHYMDLYNQTVREIMARVNFKKVEGKKVEKSINEWVG